MKLEDDQGIYGLGEAPMTSYYGLDTAACQRALEPVSKALLSFESLTPAEVHQWLDRDFPELHPFLRCTLDVAAHDLWAKTLGKRLYQCWEGTDHQRRIPTSYTIGIGSVAEMVEKIKANPWPVYKVKLGTADDLAIIRALRAVTNSPFRVDANTGWTVQQCLDLAPKLAVLGVEFIEQPLPAEDWEGHRTLFEKSALPILADESCQGEADVARCVGHFHGINIKLVKCGGLLPARRMIQTARANGMQVMVGCMTESSVGISAIAQLVPELDYVDIDGALLLADDPAEGIGISATGVVEYPDRPGTGARLRV